MGRVNERLLESIGIQVRSSLAPTPHLPVRGGPCSVGAAVVIALAFADAISFSLFWLIGAGDGLDLRRHLHAPRGAVIDGQAVRTALPAASLPRDRLKRRGAAHAGRTQEHRGRAVRVVRLCEILRVELNLGLGLTRTFSSISDRDKILQKLEEVAAELESDMNEGGWTGKTVTLKYKLDTYQGQQRYLLYITFKGAR